MRRNLFYFLGLYTLGILFLIGYKEVTGYSDYVLPSSKLLFETFVGSATAYGRATLETFGVVAIGHLLSIFAAFSVAGGVVFFRLLGPVIKSAAYTLQSYPLVAIAPIFFILVGDGILTRLLIVGSICYFPMLLTLLGIFSQPIPEVEHFFRSTRRASRIQIVRIRLLANIETAMTSITGSASLAVVGAILAEFLATNRGVGYIIRVALYRNNLAKILVALFVIGLANWFYLGLVDHCGKALAARLLRKGNLSKRRDLE